jgi:osmotically-inducible protein OsmY
MKPELLEDSIMKRGLRRSGAQHPEHADAAAQDAHLAAMLGDMYGGRPADPTASRPTDAAMAHSVQQALDADAVLAPGHVRSTVEQGWVTLDGHVVGSAEQQQAGRDALEIQGVQGVVNRVHFSHR